MKKANRWTFAAWAAILALAMPLVSCSMQLKSGGDGSKANSITVKLQDKGAYASSSARTIGFAAPVVASYKLYGALSGNAQVLLGSYANLSGATVTLEAGNYDFTLKALDASGNVVLSGGLTGVAISQTVSTLAFTLVTLTDGAGTVSVTVSWPLTVAVASASAVFNGGSSVALSLSGTSVTYTNSAATAGDHLLDIQLFDAGGNLVSSVFEMVWVRNNLTSSASIALGTGDCNSPPAAPSALVAARQADTTNAGSEAVDLSWSDNSWNETGFELDYSDNAGGTWTAIGLGPAQSSYVDSAVPRGTTRSYRIRATNSFGDSAWASAASSVLVPYLATFDYQGGGTNSTIESSSDFTVAQPSAPTWTGYTFQGWYTSATGGSAWNFATALSANQTLYAQWTATLYSIAYNLGGGTNSGSNPSSYTIESPTITFADPSRAAYTFSGWYSDSGFTTQVTQIPSGSTGAISLYAKWTAISYTISYTLNGGTNSGSNPASYTIESPTITFADPSRGALYTFSGWYSDSGFTTQVTQIPSGSTGAVSLYAKWKAKLGVNVSATNPSYQALTFSPSSVSIVQGTVCSVQTNNSTLAAASGWTWTLYLGGSTLTQSSACFGLASTATSGMLGDYLISATLPYGGVTYSGSLKLTVTAAHGLGLTAASPGAVMSLSLGGSPPTLGSPYGITYAGSFLYLADGANYRVLKIDPASGTTSVLAGSGTSGIVDGAGASACFVDPFDLCSDGINLYVCDYAANNIRQINLATGVVSTLAGSPSGSSGYQDGTGTGALFSKPAGVATDGTFVYVCDWNNEVIRRIRIATGVVTTIAGTQGVGGSSNTAPVTFGSPYRVATDGSNLYVTEYDNNDVRKISLSDASVSTCASGFTHPAGITFDGTDLYLCNADASVIDRLTLAGTWTQIVSGTSFSYPEGITNDGTNLYVVDTNNNRIIVVHN